MQPGDKRRNIRVVVRGAVLQLIITITLAAAIATVGTVVSVGFARAQSMSGSGMPEPDTSLVLGMLAGAIAVMSVLSALAVRFIGRPRQR
jgi:hypothetical protein